MQAAGADATVCGGCMVSSGALAGGAVITVPTTAPPTALPRVGVCAARRRGWRPRRLYHCQSALLCRCRRYHCQSRARRRDHHCC